MHGGAVKMLSQIISQSANEFISHKAVCRTALAKPGLLISIMSYLLCVNSKCLLCNANLCIEKKICFTFKNFHKQFKLSVRISFFVPNSTNLVRNHLSIYNDITKTETETFLNIPDPKHFYFCMLPTGLPRVVFVVS